MSSTKYLIVITGPTGIGKTDMALRLNGIYKTSIISADSRQIFKEMSIGTAKPGEQEIINGNIKLVDFLSVTENYSAGKFERDALSIIKEDHLDSDISIICGGTGFYINAVCNGLNEYPNIPSSVLDEINIQLKEKGIEELQKRLYAKDLETYNKIDINNTHRLIRALSVIEYTGKAFSSFQITEPKPRSFKVINIILNEQREIVYNKIENRVDKMIKLGLFDEVESLTEYKHLKALNSVGYSEVFRYIAGEMTKDFCINEVKKNSRRYAKRQLTWLRKYNAGIYFSPDDFIKIKDHIDASIE